MWKTESLVGIISDATRGKMKMFRLIEWIKTNPVPLNSKAFYLSNAREIAVACVKGGKPKFNGKYHSGVFSYPIHRDGGKRLHPTQKPLKLMCDLIELHTDKGDVVLDPFAGSATTLIAAAKLKRGAIGCEIDPAYYAAASERIMRECQNEQA
jgi:DNA modification methylase